MWKFRRGTLIMALKLGLTLVVFVALFVVYTSSDKPSDDPHLQKVSGHSLPSRKFVIGIVENVLSDVSAILGLTHSQNFVNVILRRNQLGSC